MIDETRLLEIYRLHRRELHSYIYKYLKSQHAAEDILHDCFERLIRYSAKYPIEDRNLRSFLYKTAHNLCINHIKKSRKYTYISLEEDSMITEEDYITGGVELEELNNKIYKALENTDGVHKSIFIMKKELGMSLQDIASALGISERTVRRKLNKVVDYLALVLEKSGYV